MTLWLGLPGFLFLMWAWWDGRNCLSYVSANVGGREVFLASDLNGVTLVLRMQGTPLKLAAASRNEVKFEHLPQHSCVLWSKVFDEVELTGLSFIESAITYPSFSISSNQDVVESGCFVNISIGIHRLSGLHMGSLLTLRVTHAVLLSSYSVAWAGAFAWRAWRRRRLTASFEPPGAA